jgi:hypothetical protein
MPRLSCPHCKNVITATEEQRGSVLTCPGCQRRIKLPADTAVARSPMPPQKSPTRPVATTDEDQIEEGPPRPRLADKDTPRSSRRPADDDEEEVEASRRDRGRQPAEDDDADEEQDQPAKKRRKRKPRNKAAVANAVSGAGTLIVLVLFCVFLSGRGLGVITDTLHEFFVARGIPPMLALGVSALVVLMSLGLVYVWLMKSTVVDAMPDEVDFVPARLRDFKKLDDDTLEDYTEALEQLGFRKLMDYTTEKDIESSITGFARLFYHDEEHCYAEINQAFRRFWDPVPMCIHLQSLLEDGWTVSTGNRQPSRELYMMRRPKAVWRSLPRAKPRKVFQAHLELREAMLEDLKIAVSEEGDAETYFEEQKEATHERKDRMRRRFALAIVLDLMLFGAFPKTEWLGAYAKKAK